MLILWGAARVTLPTTGILSILCARIAFWFGGTTQRGARAMWCPIMHPPKTPLLAYTLFLLVIELVVHKQGSHDGSWRTLHRNYG